MLGCGFFRSNASTLTICPGVQYPHWNPSSSTKACCTETQFFTAHQAFNGGDLRAGRLDRQSHASIAGQAVDKDRAGPTLSTLAAGLCAHEAKPVPQDVKQGPPRLHIQ